MSTSNTVTTTVENFDTDTFNRGVQAIVDTCRESNAKEISITTDRISVQDGVITVNGANTTDINCELRPTDRSTAHKAMEHILGACSAIAQRTGSKSEFVELSEGGPVSTTFTCNLGPNPKAITASK